jgi:hypothetical protein
MYTAFGDKSNTKNMCDSEVIFKRALASVKCMKECLWNVHIKLVITYNKSVYEYCH